MQEIAPKIFIEKDYPGVVLGIINWSRGPVLIDAPFVRTTFVCGAVPSTK